MQNSQREDPAIRIAVNNASYRLEQLLLLYEVDFYPIEHDHKEFTEHMQEVVEALQKPLLIGWSMYHFPAWYEFENGSFDGMITILTSKKVDKSIAEKIADLMFMEGAEHPQDVNAKLEKIASEAQQAFWAKVVEELYEATAGDFGPDDTAMFDAACEQAVKSWYGYNCVTQIDGEE